MQSIQREVDLYKDLKHRHIVGYIAATLDLAESTMHVFLEFVSGGSIASMLSRFGTFRPALVQNYTQQLLSGLEYLHSRGIAHRDLKGGNVLVTRDGHVKLADFGASKACSEATTKDGMRSILGSVCWMVR